MINYSEKYVFNSLFIDCLSFNPEEYALKILNKHSLENDNKIVYSGNNDSYENKLLYVVERYKNLIFHEKNENKSITIENQLNFEKENYFKCVDSKCFHIETKKLPITKFNYYETCECVKSCFINSYSL